MVITEEQGNGTSTTLHADPEDSPTEQETQDTKRGVVTELLGKLPGEHLVRINRRDPDTIDGRDSQGGVARRYDSGLSRLLIQIHYLQVLVFEALY